MSEILEIVFYVHGVSGDKSGRSHLEEYRTLHDGIRSFRDEFPNEYGGAEWGWNPTSEPCQSHQCLTEAQTRLGERTHVALTAAVDWTWNPLRLAVNPLRDLFFYNFGDMFYYVSKDGKQAVRSVVADQLEGFVRPYLNRFPEAQLSLTLLGHSAGSVIAFDFAFSLFQRCSEGHQFLEPENRRVSMASVASFENLQSMAKNGRLRLRRLITFGSPITPLAFRSDPVVELLARGEKLNPSDYGLTSNPNGFDELSGPRWLNFWDKDDVIGWPVEPLMEPGQAGTPPAVKDVYLDVSDKLSAAHGAFWGSKKMHQAIAEGW